MRAISTLPGDPGFINDVPFLLVERTDAMGGNFCISADVEPEKLERSLRHPKIREVRPDEFTAAELADFDVRLAGRVSVQEQTSGVGHTPLVAQLQTDLTQQQANNQRQSETIATLRTRIDGLERQLAKTKVPALEREVERLQGLLDRGGGSAAELSEAQRKAEAAETARAALDVELLEVRESLRNAEQRIATLVSENETLRKANAAIGTENDGLKSDVAKLTKELDAATAPPKAKKDKTSEQPAAAGESKPAGEQKPADEQKGS